MPVAETVALLASIIAIVQISDRVISCCKFYIQGASETPSELRAILVEISTLKSVLESLQFLETCSHAAPALWKQLSGQDGPIEECRRSIAQLEKLFPADELPVGGSRSRSFRKKVKLAHTSLAWPLKARRARELLQTIIQQKTMINLALTTESSQDIKSIKKDTADIRDMLTESQRQEVYRWLEKTDPSPIHNRAWKLHEEETSSWVLRSPDWNKWLAGDVRCLWIHGIPGAGKTILTSFLIEQLKTHCKHRKRSGHCYYYCFFGHNQDEASPFLTWIIARLCRQAENVPNLVYELYKRGGEPNLAEILLALENCLQNFDIVYVILDAADESKPREDLLRVIRDLATDARFSKIRCIITSRKYIDIEQSLEAVSRPMPMSNDLVAEDIRKYVRSVLHSRHKFQRWPQDLRIEVEEAVVNGSKGMFRWVVCQLDILQRLKCERNIIKRALTTLPKTLDETYERIFMDIPRDEWPFVRHVLQWVCFHQDLYKDYHSMSLEILLTATERSTCREFHQGSDFEYDAEMLRDMLGCLISVDEDDLVFLAHYTVKEYLESQRISESSTGYFWIGQETIIKEFTPTIIQEAQAITWQKENDILLHGDGHGIRDTPKAFLKDFAVYCILSALMLLLTRQSIIVSDKALLLLAVDFVDPSLSHFNNISLIINAVQDNCLFFSDQNHDFAGGYYLPYWETQPDRAEAGILLSLLVQACQSDVPILAQAYLEGKDVCRIAQSHVSFTTDIPYHVGNVDWVEDKKYTFNGPLLEVMAQLFFFNPEPFTWLLDQCDNTMDTGLLLAAVGAHEEFHDKRHSDQCVLKKILRGQADPNAAGYRVTPLQIAVATLDVEGVIELLEAGADTNTTGDQNGVPFSTNSILEWFNELHGISPLQICRNPTGRIRDYHNEIPLWRAENKSAIEDLLVKHGAKECSALIEDNHSS